MKRSALVFTSVLVLSLLCLPAAVALPVGDAGPVRLGDPPPSVPSAWTVALYVDADNNLERMWDRYDVPELKRLPLDPRVNIVALVDRRGRTGVRLVRFGGGRATVLARYPERDFGSSATLKWFLRKTQTLFPADRTLVDLWDHGSAWTGLCWDDTSGHHLTMADLRSALIGANVPIDILACDTCLSADAAFAYDVSQTGVVDYLVASEEVVPGDGFSYDAMLGSLLADPARPTGDVLSALVDGYERYYRGLEFVTPTNLSAIDLAKVREMRPDLQRWSAALRAALPADATRVAFDLRRSPWALLSYQVDLGAAAARLAADEWLSSGELRAASAAVAADVRAAVLAEAGSAGVPRLTGMAIWWAGGGEWSRNRMAFLRDTLFARDSGWYSFLNAADRVRPRLVWLNAETLYEAGSLNDVVFTDVLHGRAVGYDRVFGWSSGIALVTDDGGATWDVDVEAGSVGVLSGLTRLGGRFASVGSSGYGSARLVRLGGERPAFSVLPSSAYFFDIDAAGTHAWAGGEKTLLATTDGGKSWHRLPAAPSVRLTSVALADATHGWVIGEDLMGDVSTIYASADGGALFDPQFSLAGVSLRCLEALSASEVWACGGDRLGGDGVILHTADGGATWTPQLSGTDVPQLADVWMRDATTGWAVGDAGAVYATDDGGTTWQRSAGVGTRADLKAVTFSDARHGCIVGDGGEILVTANGGATWIDHAADVTVGAAARWAPQVHRD